MKPNFEQWQQCLAQAQEIVGRTKAQWPNCEGVMACSGGSEVPSYQSQLDQLTSGLPTQLQEQQTYQPQYTELGLQNANADLMGLPGLPGYLQDYANSVTPAISNAQNTANAALATGTVGNINNLGSGAASAISNVNPQMAQLLQSLTGSATSEMQAGAALPANQADQTINAVNTNWANRGLDQSAPAALSAAMQYYMGGQNQLTTAQNTAGAVANENNTLLTNPALNLVTTQSTAPGTAAGVTNAGGVFSQGQQGPSIIPESDLSSLSNTLLNANAASSIGNANNNAAICGSAIGAGGSIL